MTVISYPPLRRVANSLFLGGSIEMGKARDWQAEAIELLKNHFSVIYNPRRPDWDSSWEQDISNPYFKEQVDWELDMIEIATWVLFNYEPDTISPISLLENGRRVDNVVVVCPPGYFRKGNVDIFCRRHDIPVYHELEKAASFLRAQVFREVAGTYHNTASQRSLKPSIYPEKD
jgi:hypothetical protein